jgi:glutamyl/glutaminyl-tRNA synthetase
VPNTPLQLMLWDAMGAARPLLGHFPVVLGKDGKKLSKRLHPEARLDLFREEGYLPEALLNYLALLGWNPGTEEEIFTIDELVGAFTFDRVQHAGARFDWEKLNWIDGEYIRRLSIDDLVERLKPFVPQVDGATLRKAAPALQTRMHKLSQAVDYLEFLWKEPAPPALEPEAAKLVKQAIEAVREVPWQPEAIEAALEKAVVDSGVGKGKFYTPLRDALTGKKVALPIHYCFGLLPKEVALERLMRAANQPV